MIRSADHPLRKLETSIAESYWAQSLAGSLYWQWTWLVGETRQVGTGRRPYSRSAASSARGDRSLFSSAT